MIHYTLVYFNSFSKPLFLGVERIAIVVTDGTATIDRQTTLSEAARAKAANIHLCAVAVGASISEAYLAVLVSAHAFNNLFRTDHFRSLGHVVDRLFRVMCDVNTHCKLGI